MPPSYALFSTVWGPCGIAWTERGICAVQLPEQTEEATRSALIERSAGASPGIPPPMVRRAMELIAEHLAGRPQSFAEARLDLADAPDFHRRVWEAARKIRAGSTASYGELAERVGSPGAARAVGQAMARNRVPLIVPCHRVLAANRGPGGFSAWGGLRTKGKLLEIEGVALQRQASLFSGAGRLAFDARAGVRAVCAADSRLAELIAKVGPFRLQLEELHGTFEALFEAIVYQQLNGKAAATIVERAKALFDPSRMPTAEEIAGASEARLRSAGLSGSKILALKDLAAKTLEGIVPAPDALERMEDEAIVERLTVVRGIGRWTAEMLLIFRLGRPDVLPIHDYGIRKGFAEMLGKKGPAEPEAILRRGERWRPFRTIASWYLWRALELPSIR